MKKFAFILPLFLLATIALKAQDNSAIERFFSQYADDERFTSVYISPKLFSYIAKIETNDPEWNSYREVVANLGGLRVLTADSVSDGLSLYKSALSKVPKNEYEELLTVRDGDENVRIWIKDTGNVIEELLLLVGEPTEFTLVSFTGKIDIDKISEIAKKLDIEGAGHLEKMKSKDKEKETGNQ